MAEKLTIHNFGGIKDAVIEPKPITIFIGQQASGKSVTAKLLYFFRSLGGQLTNAILDKMDYEAFEKHLHDYFCRFFPPATWSDEFVINYENNGYLIGVFHGNGDGENKPLRILLGNFFREALPRLVNFRKDHLAEMSGMFKTKGSVSTELNLSLIQQEIQQTLGSHATSSHYFIPAARAIYSYLKPSESADLFDPTLKRFGFLLEQSRTMMDSIDFFSGQETSALHLEIADILKATPIRQNERDFLQTPDQRLIPMSFSSSGQQEAWPLLLLLVQLWHFGTDDSSLYIEEPEVHIFPEAQYKIVKFLVSIYKLAPLNEAVMTQIITTHSPYVLTSLNNLIQAGIAHRKAANNHELKQKLKKIIPESNAIYPEEITAYSFQDGQVTSIMDAESQLITADYIDQVSEDIAEDFDKLLWLE